jgi:hypothetical protein
VNAGMRRRRKADTGERQSVEASASSCLAICSCGWRDITTSRRSAWLLNLTHARRAHPLQDNRNTELQARRHYGDE